jgi:hypothetical protein
MPKSNVRQSTLKNRLRWHLLPRAKLELLMTNVLQPKWPTIHHLHLQGRRLQDVALPPLPALVQKRTSLIEVAVVTVSENIENVAER